MKPNVTGTPAALATLSRDAIMGELVETFGRFEWSLSAPYESLTKSIVGQMLSNQAAGAILNRLELAFDSNPKLLVQAPTEIFSFGLPV